MITFNRRNNTYFSSKVRVIEMKIYSYQGRQNICGRLVKKYRKERGITQTEFASKLQVCNVILDQKAISRIELGLRVVADYELWAMAQVLGVGIEDLLESAMPATQRV
jgi:transcriptional regulator with XRE-family HTH domain